jgi:hypothetical protein
MWYAQVDADSYEVGAEQASGWHLASEDEVRAELERVENGGEVEAEDEVGDEESFWLGYRDTLEAILEQVWD